MIQAIVGAGGKTTLIRRRAEEYRRQGLRVLVTTTTHMFIEEDTILDGGAEEIVRALKEKGYAMAGVREGEKIAPLPDEVYKEACAHADVVLVEADGSKHLPIKFPAAHEPVIPQNADEIVVVCGLHALGRRLGEAAHRPELAAACLGISQDTPVTAQHIQTLAEKGYAEPLARRYPDKKITIAPSHDGSLYQRAIAALMAAREDVSLIRREWFEPQPRLFICGGGHISCELVRMASLLDFQITVMDDREEFASAERFPQADEVICDSFENLARHLTPDSCCVVVTRGHRNDLVCVREILKHPFGYLGMIGSRAKVQTTFETLAKEGISQEKIDAVHAPIGLDIGAQTPAEIAVSILAQIIREKNRRHASSASRELLAARGRGVLCVITEKTGSAPRGAGSMMFVGEGQPLGSIGGGAVEHAAIVEAGKTRRVTSREYDLSSRESAELGMICGGRCRVLFIPLA